MKNFGLDVVSGLILAVATSFLTVRLSLKRFRTEKWWELQSQSYSALLEDLGTMRSVAKERYGDEIGEYQLKDARHLVLAQRWREGKDRIVLRAEAGGLYLSNVTVEALGAFLKALEAPGATSPFDELEMTLSAAEQVIATVGNEARRDLRRREKTHRAQA